MAHFFGTLKGGCGEATRLGTRTSGLAVQACSWEGKVQTYLYEKDGRDFARVSLAQHHGHGTERVLYDGPVGG